MRVIEHYVTKIVENNSTLKVGSGGTVHSKTLQIHTEKGVVHEIVLFSDDYVLIELEVDDERF